MASAFPSKVTRSKRPCWSCLLKSPSPSTAYLYSIDQVCFFRELPLIINLFYISVCMFIIWPSGHPSKIKSQKARIHTVFSQHRLYRRKEYAKALGNLCEKKKWSPCRAAVTHRHTGRYRGRHWMSAYTDARACGQDMDYMNAMVLILALDTVLTVANGKIIPDKDLLLLTLL